jgi:hypothetical protein
VRSHEVRCQWLTPVILATWEGDQEDSSSKPPQANSSRNPILKYPIQKMAGTVTQVVEHLPSKCEALSSNPSTKKE